MEEQEQEQEEQFDMLIVSVREDLGMNAFTNT